MDIVNRMDVFSNFFIFLQSSVTAYRRSAASFKTALYTTNLIFYCLIKTLQLKTGGFVDIFNIHTFLSIKIVHICNP